MTQDNRMLLSGNEAVALAAFDAQIALGTGYPGTPSTEILESLSALGGRAQWAPNEKVALEVAIGAAFGAARALVTMKHVGLNVAADPLFTAAYTGVGGALVIAVADDPGMASSQNEQDSRRFAVAAGVPMIEPSDSQEAYDHTLAAFRLSERWRTPVLLRLTTRVSHSKTVVVPRPDAIEPPAPPAWERDIPGRVMIPAYARVAHRKLRETLADLDAARGELGLDLRIDGDRSLGIVASGVAYVHAREAAPEASFFKVGLSYPPPLEALRAFADSVDRVVVIEEGDPCLVEAMNAAGIRAEGKPEMYHFGELNVPRVRRILDGDTSPEPPPPKGKPPQLCTGCPHRFVFETLREMDCVVAGDIGCYTLGVLPPFEAMDTCVCMGASVGVGLGLRHVLPPDDARRVVSVIGDSTFIHSGLTGVVEMVYNPPPTGHLLLILDNGTTAMTGLQEHPGTGRALDHTPADQVVIEEVCRAIGVRHVDIVNPTKEADRFQELVAAALGREELSVVIARRPCVLAAPKIMQYEQADPRAGATAGGDRPE